MLHIIKNISEDEAFEVPCRISQNSAGNAWSWDYLAWFRPGNSYSMAAGACAALWYSSGTHSILTQDIMGNYDV